MSEWHEPLPGDCPPNDAQPSSGQVFFRLAGAFPPTEDDFLSFRTLNPNKATRDECLERAVSIWDSMERCKSLLKLPTQHGKVVVSVGLSQAAGPLKQTGRNRQHYSWWRRVGFDPLSIAVLVYDPAA